MICPTISVAISIIGPSCQGQSSHASISLATLSARRRAIVPLLHGSRPIFTSPAHIFSVAISNIGRHHAMVNLHMLRICCHHSLPSSSLSGRPTGFALYTNAPTANLSMLRSPSSTSTTINTHAISFQHQHALHQISFVHNNNQSIIRAEVILHMPRRSPG